MSLAEKLKKISILDVLRKNLFWAGILLFILILGGAYFFFIMGLDKQLSTFKETADKSFEMLQAWQAKPFIPNETCTKDAEKNSKNIGLYQSQLLLLYAMRPDPLTDRSILTDIVEEPSDRLWVQQERDWWTAYTAEGETLLKQLQARFNAPENVFQLEKKQTGKNELQLRVFDNDFCVIREVVEGLLAASPAETPYINLLESIKVDKGFAGTIKHDWVKAVCVNVMIGINYENLAPLIQNLQKLPRPIMVSSYTVTQFPPKPGEKSPGLRVMLRCELLKFRPIIATINFSGERFAKKDQLRSWIETNDRELSLAALTLAKMIPSYKYLVTELEAKVQPEFDQVGPVPPLDREKLLKTLKRNIPYTIIHDHLNTLIPAKAYCAAYENKKLLVIAKIPDDPKNDGRWVIADYTAGTSYPATYSLKAMCDHLEQKPVRQVRVDISGKDGAKVVIFKDVEKGEPVQVLMSDDDGVWRVCPVIVDNGRPVTLSDIAFRLPAVVKIMPSVEEKELKVGEKGTIEFQKLAKKAKSQEHTYNIKDNGQAGKIVIKSGYRD